MKEPLFLTLSDVLNIHTNQIEQYGGSHGVRDMHLLQSALAQPEASFGGVWLHEDLYEMAAAYAFHIAQNHPFIDGNKRAALASAIVFLKINECSPVGSQDAAADALLKLASGKLSKKDFAALLRSFPKED